MEQQMIIRVLSDNIENGALRGEWGLSLLIEYEGKKVLLDSGASSLFAENAVMMGIDLAAVDYAVLSHAHYDHSDGMDAFFDRNGSACFYLSSGCGENCYCIEEDGLEYIGIRRGLLEKYSSRIRYSGKNQELFPGAYLLCHSTPGLETIGEKAKMYTGEPSHLVFDDFAHEQILVFDTPRGLAVFCSCSHAGVDNIIREVKTEYPGKEIYAYVGGMHLYESSDDDVLSVARVLALNGIRHVITGHCTGDRAFDILKAELDCDIIKMHSGLVLEI